MKKLFSFALLVLALITLAGCNTQTSIYTFELDSSYDGYITMGTSADYPPYEWPMTVDGKTTLVGIDIELGKAIAHALNKNLKVINKGFDFLIDDLAAGKVDFVIAGMSPTPSRAEVVDFSSVYFAEEDNSQVVIVKQANLANFGSFEQLNQSSVRVGAQSGAIQANFVDLFSPNAQKTLLLDMAELMTRLNAGQLDAVYTEGPVFESYLGAYPDFVIALQVDSPYNGSAVAVKKGSGALLTTINEVIEALNADGTIAQWVADFTALAASQE